MANPPAIPPGVSCIGTAITPLTAAKNVSVSVATGGARILSKEGMHLATYATKRTLSKAQLYAYKPSNIRKDLAQALQKAKQTGSSAMAIAGHKLMEFPEEAFAFFLALTALAYAQVIFNYKDNPVHVYHFMQSQKDPVTHVGFAAFMVANGWVSAPLMQIVQNPNLKTFIPYLGMSMGMTASNIVHEVGHFPGLMACAKQGFSSKSEGEETQEQLLTSILTGEPGKKDPCDEAYEAWIETNMFEKLTEYAPMFMSMLTSVYVSGIITTCAAVAAGALAARVSVSAVQVGFKILAGAAGWILVPAPLKFGIKIGQAGLFLAMDMYVLAPLITGWWNTRWYSGDIRDLDTQILQDLAHARAGGFKPKNPESCYVKNEINKTVLADHCEPELKDNLKDMLADLKKWREFNQQTISMAHHAWLEKLSQLANQYQASYDVYGQFTSQAHQLKYETVTPQGSFRAPLYHRAAPLNGVYLTTEEDQKNIPIALLENYDLVEEQQEQRVLQAGRMLADAINDTKHNWKDSDKRRMSEISQLMLNEDNMEKGKGISRLNMIAYGQAQSLGYSDALRRFLKDDIRKFLGNPQPIYAPGRAFMEAIRQHPNLGPRQHVVDSTVKGNTLIDTSARIQARNYTDWIFMNMLLGPDPEKGESVIRSSRGYPAEFRPPRITANNLCYINNQPNMAESIFSIKATPDCSEVSIYSKNFKPRNQMSTAYQYLSQPNMIRSSVLDHTPAKNKQQFENWWQYYVEGQYVQAWLNFEQKYQAIVHDLMTAFNRTDDSINNRSFVANGIKEGLMQQYKFGVLLLGEVLRTKVSEDPRIYTMLADITTTPLMTSQRPQDLRNPSLFGRLRNASLNLDFTALAGDVFPGLGVKVPQDNRLVLRNFKFQYSMMREMNRLVDLISEIKPIELRDPENRGTFKAVSSPVSSSAITAQMEKLDAVIKSVSDIFGTQSVASMIQTLMENNQIDVTDGTNIDPTQSQQVIEDLQKQAASQIQFTEYEKEIVALAMEYIDSAKQEMATIGQIANAVSYIERHGGGEPVNPNCSVDNGVIMQKSALGKIARASCK